MRELDKGIWRIRLYPAIRSLTELKFKQASATPRGRHRTTVFADNAERDRALAARADELIADGWVPVGAPPRKTAAPKLDTLEEAFGALAATTITALDAASTDAQDAAIWRRAIAAYGRLKVKAGGDRTEHLVHFFSVDGIALERSHPVVVKRVKAPKRRKARWAGLLAAAR